MRTPSPFRDALQKIENAKTKIGNIFEFELADLGRRLIRFAQADFRRFNNEVVRQRNGELLGVKINICTEFSPINACFVLGLYEMGAKVKWVTNDKHF